MGGPPPPGGIAPPAGGMMMPPAPKVNLIKLNKPEMKPALPLRAFVWKRVVIDRQGGTFDVAKSDLTGPDPSWKGKTVVWKDIKEHKAFDLQLVEQLFPAKVKAEPKRIMDTGQIDMNKPKTFFPPDKSQNLFIVLSRLPKADSFLQAVDMLNEKTVSIDNLSSLIKNWPNDEFEPLVEEASESGPMTKWEKTEAYFIKLGTKKKFNLRIQIWLFKLQFEQNIKDLTK